MIEFAVEDGLAGAWDEHRLGALVRSIVERDPLFLSLAHPEPVEGSKDERVDVPLYAISLHLVGNDTIRSLNHEHRGLDSHTDVLSFPLHDPNGMRFVLPPGQPASLGDVVVSYPRALEQARDFGHSIDRELGYLVAHGVLHVLGYDHEEPAERRIMRQKEEEALAPLGFIR
jgi:probable rRNA maturation factor